MIQQFVRVAALAAALFAAAFSPASVHAQTVKIAYIDPLSGAVRQRRRAGPGGIPLRRPTASTKSGVLGKVKLEVIGFDNKVSPQESLNQLKRVIDQDIRYITQGNSSAVAGALIEAVNRHNERNPGKEILYLNYAAVDPAYTNDKCSFWHFRFDANSDMKMESLTTWMAGQKNIKKVYLLNQDYSFGHAVKKAAREMLARKRPDIQIVGDDLHPLGKVSDFAPYVAKIKAAGADSVITGNWGNDMSLLVKAGKDAGLNVELVHLLRRRPGHADRDGRGGGGQGEDHRRVPLERRQQQGGEVGRRLPQAGAQGQPGLLLPARQDHVGHVRQGDRSRRSRSTPRPWRSRWKA